MSLFVHRAQYGYIRLHFLYCAWNVLFNPITQGVNDFQNNIGKQINKWESGALFKIRSSAMAHLHNGQSDPEWDEVLSNTDVVGCIKITLKFKVCGKEQ